MESQYKTGRDPPTAPLQAPGSATGWTEVLAADLNEEARVVDILQPTALQGLQVPVGSWAQQVQILRVHFEAFQLLLQLGSILGGRGQGREHAQLLSQNPRAASLGEGVASLHPHDAFPRGRKGLISQRWGLRAAFQHQ